MSKALLALVAASLMLGVAVATTGIDISSYMTTSSYDFAIVRGWQSNGVFDGNCPGSVANAWAAGMAHVDVYMFPCVPCGNPAGQVQEFANNLNANGVSFGMIWMDVEVLSWSGSCGDNQNFIASLVSTAQNLGYNVGIYTNAYNWNSITCGWTGVSNLPLWYAHYDENPSFGDFSPFGGWNTPAIKQYAGDAQFCGADVDKNYY